MIQETQRWKRCNRTWEVKLSRRCKQRADWQRRGQASHFSARKEDRGWLRGNNWGMKIEHQGNAAHIFATEFWIQILSSILLPPPVNSQHRGKSDFFKVQSQIMSPLCLKLCYSSPFPSEQKPKSFSWRTGPTPSGTATFRPRLPLFSPFAPATLGPAPFCLRALH